MSKIHTAMVSVMRDIGAITKDRKNEQQRYNFRGIDDVYNALHSVLARHGVFTTSEIVGDPRREERTNKNGTVLLFTAIHVRYTFHAEDGSYLTTEIVGEGMDSGDKASNKAISAAHKYALLQAFAIPTAEPKDSEEETHELRPKTKPTPKPTVSAEEITRATESYTNNLLAAETRQEIHHIMDAGMAKAREYNSREMYAAIKRLGTTLMAKQEVAV